MLTQREPFCDKPPNLSGATNRIEGDYGALKQLFKPKRGVRRLTAAENTLKGIETHRTIKKGPFREQ
ncbi:MAG: DDE-type integrase/transposase/recombinase [Paracoccaceae bacterium]